MKDLYIYLQLVWQRIFSICESDAQWAFGYKILNISVAYLLRTLIGRL